MQFCIDHCIMWTEYIIIPIVTVYNIITIPLLKYLVTNIIIFDFVALLAFM